MTKKNSKQTKNYFNLDACNFKYMKNMKITFRLNKKTRIYLLHLHRFKTNIQKLNGCFKLYKVVGR